MSSPDPDFKTMSDLRKEFYEAQDDETNTDAEYRYLVNELDDDGS